MSDAAKNMEAAGFGTMLDRTFTAPLAAPGPEEASAHPFPFIGGTSTRRDFNGGDQYKFRFHNGYGASIVRHSFSYGHESGLWELAVLGADGHLTYDTSVSDDVVGWLDEQGVADYLSRIEALS